MGTETIDKTQILTGKDLIKVLLVEDDAVDRQIVERILTNCPWPVEFVIESVGSLSEAVECLGSKGHDIVLLDLVLPDSSGVETVHRISEINPHIPIIVLTGLDDEGTGLLAIENGATDYLIKDQSLDKILIRTVLYALARKKETENWWRTFDAISDLVFIQDKDFTITKANKAFAEALNSKPQDIIGKKCYEVLHNTSTPWPGCPYQKTHADLKSHTEEINDPLINIPLLVTTSPILDDNGNLIGGVHIAKDVTEQKKAEKLILDTNLQLRETSQKLLNAKQELEKKNEALEKAHKELETRVEERTAELSKANELLKKEIAERKQMESYLRASEANLRKVIVGNPDGIVIVDKNGIVRFVNPAAESLFGREDKELLGETFGFPMVLDETTEVETIHKTKGIVIVEMRMVEIDWEGEISYLASLHNITERKEAEEKMKKAMEIKSEFISMASHELRTPLTAIKEGVRLVIQEQTGKLNDEQKEFLGIVKRNVERLARLINDILDFQKLESGKMDVDMQKNDVNEIVKEIKETMTPLSSEKGLNLIIELDDSLPIIKFDKDKITQVLTNIVNNAIKFTEQGSVTISTTKGDNDNIIQVSVADTGPGIKNEDLPRLFHEFEQLAGGNERKTGGSGLGLAISRKIIKKHNATIWAESEPGKGTTFHFVLPIKERRRKLRD